MKIRLAQEGDAPALAALRWEFRAEGGERPAVPYAEFAAHYVAFIRVGLATGERGHVVAEGAGGALLGHVVCQVVPLVPRPCRLDDACGVITDNYVRAAYRARGVGGAARGGPRMGAFAGPRDRDRLAQRACAAVLRAARVHGPLGGHGTRPAPARWPASGTSDLTWRCS